MVERRNNPVDRCPERVKQRLAHASVRMLIKRIIAAKKRERKED